MVLDKNCKIWKATSKDILREALQYVYFDGEDTLIATDGHIMAVVKVDGEKAENTPRLISADLLRSSRPEKFKQIEIGLNGRASTHSGPLTIFCDFPDEIEFPSGYKKIVAAAKKLLNRKKDKFVVALNAGLLKNLADAMDCSEQVFLHFDKKELDKTGTYTGHISVKTSSGNDNFGIIMPIRVPDEDR